MEGWNLRKNPSTVPTNNFWEASSSPSGATRTLMGVPWHQKIIILLLDYYQVLGSGWSNLGI